MGLVGVVEVGGEVVLGLEDLVRPGMNTKGAFGWVFACEEQALKAMPEPMIMATTASILKVRLTAPQHPFVHFRMDRV